MMAKSWYTLFPDDETSVQLGCEFTIRDRQIWLLGADVYASEGGYCAYWRREDMAEHLIKGLQKWLEGDPSGADALSRARRGLPRRADG